jgi:LSD1 subclass zinc finger protein
VVVSTGSTARLELLRCDRCATPVALADADTVACPSCGAAVAVPAAHRTAFADARRDTAARAEARALYARLGAPPRALRALGVIMNPSSAIRPLRRNRHLLVRGLAWYYGWFAVVLGPIAMFLVAIFAVNLTLRAVGAAQHANVMDTLPMSTRDWIQVPISIAALLVGTALGVYGRRRAISRRRLQASLAARPPSRDGGPSECRLCGAPLSVPADALGVRCAYCGADNLVALPPVWLAAVGAEVAEAAAAIDEASAALGAERARLRRALRWRIGITVAALVVIVGLAVVVTYGSSQRDDSVPPSWTAYATDPRPLVRRDPAPGRTDGTLAERVTALGFASPCPAGAQPLPIGPADCAGGACVVRLYAALRSGDHATLVLSGVPATTCVRVSRHTGWPWPRRAGGEFGEPVATVTADAGGAFAFAADWSAWHELEVTLPGAAPPAVTACFTATAAR